MLTEGDAEPSCTVVKVTNNTYIFFYRYTVHSDIHTVHSPTDASVGERTV